MIKKTQILHKFSIASKLTAMFVGVVLLFLPLQNALAVQNPSFIMPDDVFANVGSMNESQIQAFLVARNSYLAYYHVPGARDVAYLGTTYHESPMVGPVGGEVDSTGWTISHLIYQTAQWYGINPQVILATIQKESSLVTQAGGPAYYGLEQWIMGYAYTDSGIKSVCKTNTNQNPTGSCAGIAMQIDWGAGSLMFNYNGSASRSASVSPYWAGNTVSLGGGSVYLGNNSTASLYRYTPYTPYSANYVWFFNTYFQNIDYVDPGVPVYRFYNFKNNTHFYTASEAEKNSVAANLSKTYRLEGVAYRYNPGNPSNAFPLYRFYNGKSGTHFYTASEAEKNNVLATMGSTYRLDGIAYNISFTSGTPVYRFYNKVAGTHFYTISESEKNNVINTMAATYRLDGIAFYVAN